MHPDVEDYNARQQPEHRAVCALLAREIDVALPNADNRIWHAHPVWFLDGNPTVGYSRQKPGIRLMFWSGKDFDAPGLNIVGGKFKDASVFYNHAADVNLDALRRWLRCAQHVQWNYRDIRRNGGLVRL